jgi:hypothetical protein
VPFRLLGVIAKLEEVDSLCGQLLKSYAKSGTEVTLAAITAAADAGSLVHRLGLHDLIRLDAPPVSGEERDLEEAFRRVITTVRPHVVVHASDQSAIWSVLASAVSKERSLKGGSAALPAKLYYRPSANTPAVAVTTAVRIPGATSRALFVRAFPSPWVTGVLEDDLFCGLVGERDDARRLLAAS